MVDKEDFLSRWSRLKREENTDGDSGSTREASREGETPASAEASPAGDVAPPFDPETLPPIESIDAGSDIRAFLAPGVPADMKRAALRRAWSSDLSIRDFVGLSENSWDFNAPETIFGFGSIETHKVQELLARLLSSPEEAAETECPPPMPAEAEPVVALPEDVSTETIEAPTAVASPTVEASRSVALPTVQGRAAQTGNGRAVPSGIKTSQLDETAVAPQNGLAPRRPEKGALPRRHGSALPE